MMELIYKHFQKAFPLVIFWEYFILIQALGMPGISGFLPLFKIGLVDKNQTIYISAAAGAVG